MPLQMDTMMNKKYTKIYYKNHKKEYHERYLKSLIGGRKKSINKSNYGREPLKKLLIERYGKKLKKTKDNITLTAHKKKIFCVDCIYYKRGRILKGCPGWDKCPFKEEILKEIK